MSHRRDFLCAAAGAAVLPWLSGHRCNAAVLHPTDSRPPARILLRSSWQVVNIGDIAHTPGVLALLEKYLPQAEVRLWASGDLTPEVAAMEHNRFPKLQIVKGTIGEDGRANNAELQAALDWCDFLLHGSGPSLVAQKDVAAFVKHYRQPFGVYGITYGGGNNQAAELMSKARFVYFRDSVSLEKAKEEKIAPPVIGFAPDGAFACDLRNDAAAEAWLAGHGLERGKFACCLARARNTPYWLVRSNTKLDEAKQARNLEMFEHDMAPIRLAIARVVKETGLKVLLCPEDRTQVQISRDWLYDKLPDDVRDQVIWRDSFWLTDEALSTYVRSAGVFGTEMHSPIMSVGNGVPAIVGRFAEQTSKGYMWRDIGLGDWLFDFDRDDDIARYPDAVVKMLSDKPGSTRKVAEAQAKLAQLQQDTMQSIRV